MRLVVGTSGYGYGEWKGRFYPSGLDAAHMLAYYALRLPAVEIGRTSRGMPGLEVLEHWSHATPAEFVFALKAPRHISQPSHLAHARDEVEALFSTAQLLGHKLGPILFECPDKLATDAVLLDRLLEPIPSGARAAVEFRGQGPCDDRVLGLLERRGVALCASDDGDDASASRARLVPTASFGYVRLSAASYSDDALEDWADRIGGQRWSHAFVIFAPQDHAAAPKLALRMLEFAEAAEPQPKPVAKTQPAAAAGDDADGAPASSSHASHGEQAARPTRKRAARPKPLAKARSRKRRTRWRAGTKD